MKKVTDRFESRELTCSVFDYPLPEFKKLKASKVVSEWQEDLESNSSSYPTMFGSPFEGALPTSIDEEPENGRVYVVPHYFYEYAEYSIEEPIDKTYEIKLAPIVGALLEEAPMDWAEKNGEQVYFEGQEATNGTEPMVNFYCDGKLILSVLLSDVDDDILKNVAKKIG